MKAEHLEPRTVVGYVIFQGIAALAIALICFVVLIAAAP